MPGNDLAELRYGMFTGLNLTELYLMSNNTSKIENGTFKDLRYLSMLHLGHNSLVVLQPDVFIGLEHLDDLDLGFNKLFSTDAAFFDMFPNETKIGVIGNPLDKKCVPFLEPENIS